MDSVNKHSIGLFNGNAIPAPYAAKEGYDPTSRYRKGLTLLTQIAAGKDFKLGEGENLDSDVRKNSKRALEFVQLIEAQHERFFNRRFNMNKLISENHGEVFGNKEIPRMVQDAIRIPNFNKDFQKTIGDFGAINWTSTTEKIKNGMSLTHDHNFSFYEDIMNIAGKSDEFDTYKQQMSRIQNLLMGNNVINPLDYMEARNSIDKDVASILQNVIVDLNNNNIDPYLKKKLENHPSYILMGGGSYFKGGINLEKSASRPLDALKSIKIKNDNLQRVKDQQLVEESSQQKLKNMMEDLIELKKC